jgi:hypothetical protein
MPSGNLGKPPKGKGPKPGKPEEGVPPATEPAEGITPVNPDMRPPRGQHPGGMGPDDEPSEPRGGGGGKRKANPGFLAGAAKWRDHLAEYRIDHPGKSLKQQMQGAKKTYKKSNPSVGTAITKRRPARTMRRKKTKKRKPSKSKKRKSNNWF